MAQIELNNISGLKNTIAFDDLSQVNKFKRAMLPPKNIKLVPNKPKKIQRFLAIKIMMSFRQPTSKML